MKKFAAENLKNVYSPYHEPLGTVDPGEVFQIDTEDGFAGGLRRPEDFTPERLAWAEERWCIATGPIAVAGATPDHVAAVKIHAMEIITDGYVIISHYRSPSADDWWLPEELDRVKAYPVVDGHVQFSGRCRIPVKPIIGCLATAPKHEVILTRKEGEFGGNQDCNLMTSGSTIILPVNVAGGLLYFGDCKAIMARGEIVNAPECGMRITASVELRQRSHEMTWPRVETDEILGTVVSDINAADACRRAFRELMLWLEAETGASRQDIAMLMGMVSDTTICQVSNTFHTAQCTIPRSYTAVLAQTGADQTGAISHARR
jgi:amidase